MTHTKDTAQPAITVTSLYGPNRYIGKNGNPVDVAFSIPSLRTCVETIFNGRPIAGSLERYQPEVHTQ